MSVGSVKGTDGYPSSGDGAIPIPTLQIRKADWFVQTVDLAVARDLVTRYHYARGGSNTATFRHGLFRRKNPTVCCGVAWWLPPTKGAALASYPEKWQAVLSLSRLVIVPDVPKNAASFLLAHSIRLLRQDPRWKCLITYADPWQGHVGTIYQATGWEWTGESSKTDIWLDATGKMVARKAGPHTRTKAEMVSLGHHKVASSAKLRYRKVL